MIHGVVWHSPVHVVSALPTFEKREQQHLLWTHFPKCLQMMIKTFAVTHLNSHV